MSHSEKIVAMIDAISGQVNDIRKGSGNWWEKLDQIIRLVVISTETIDKELKGEDKKEIATAVLLDLQQKYFNAPFIPDFIERPLVAHLINKGIDSAVSALNKAGIFKHSNP